MIHLGDCIEVLKSLPENSVDAIVTDPPYGFAFMGKKWDYDLPSVEIWKECLRVLKPGGHMLAFGGPRTYHRMACGVEDAGFEIRDQLQWLFGSGFPKSLDISKAIDKAAGAEREVTERVKTPYTAKLTPMNFSQLKTAGEDGYRYNEITAPATPEAKLWEGWGTALKPANEPILLARKPLSEKTVAANVLKWGTGGLNIDAGRIAGSKRSPEFKAPDSKGQFGQTDNSNLINWDASQGRFPANLVLDEVAAEMLDAQSGNSKEKLRVETVNSMGYHGGSTGGASRFFYVAKASKREKNAGLDCNDPIWDKESWEKPGLKLSTESINQLAKDISEDILKADKLWNTDLSGLNISEKSRQDLISTIKITIKLIIELRISNSSQSSHIRESIRVAIRTIGASGLSLAESVELLNQSPPNSINEKMVSPLGAVLAVLQMLLTIKGFAKFGAFHPTIKPIKLMEYLIKLITPPNGTVLDPFMGSGSTGITAERLGFHFIGIERENDYFEIAKRRMELK